ncbi:hypothetical protein F5883DRAFT_592306 [Diaporthe sp. PMI_573]|nr:hypothetical protein F5883DRAFT_592306 [Diaporthaceae sp. PMI_573]
MELSFSAFQAKMPDEWTSLLEKGPMGPSTRRDASQGLFSSDLAYAALCATFKLLSYCLKYIAYFYPSGQQSTVFPVLSEVSNCVVQLSWAEIVLSFDAAVFKAFNAVTAAPEQPDESKKAASRANRKATAIPDALQASLGLLDQSITTFLAFSKAGCSWLFACGASILTLCLPLVLQLKSKKLVSDVSVYRRQKENAAGKEGIFPIYANSSRSLRQSDFRRRVCILLALGLLVLIANPPEPHAFILILPMILHTDEKVVKMWKASADTKPVLPFLRAQYPLPDQRLHQEITHNSAHRPHPAPREIQRVLRLGYMGKEMAQVLTIWIVGAGYKREMLRPGPSKRTTNGILPETDMMV